MEIQKTDTTNKIYFPGLNGLRFIAAFIVIIDHTEQMKQIFGYTNNWNSSMEYYAGDLGVSLFFVLSGFLITYLLLKEKNQNNNKISVKDFYIRRILRIWPLYFLIIILGLFILPMIPFLKIPVWSDQLYYQFPIKIILFFLVLPNAVFVLFPPIPFTSQSWSIGVEEQFYLIWALILNKTRKYLFFFISIIITMIILTNIFNFFVNRYIYLIDYKIAADIIIFLRFFIVKFKISCMAIGALGAYLLIFNKDKILKIVYRNELQIFAVIIIILSVIFKLKIRYVSNEIFSLLFCFLIVNISSNKKSIIKLENIVFNFLGKISYGLYMYHPLSIVISIVTLKTIFNSIKFNDFISNILLYSCCFLITIVLSTISYFLFEKFFLNLKVNFSKLILKK
jgi:peptidoglycan/LPS O-acetylase OafA/YrhL